MSEQREQRCETCRFFAPHVENDEKSEGDCKRMPPVCVEKHGWMRPPMDHDDWCGEWQSAGETPVKRCPQLLYASDVRELTGLTTIQIGKLAKAGELPSVQLPGNEIRFIESDVAEWVERHRAKPAGPA